MRLIKFGQVFLPDANGDHSMPVNARSSLLNLRDGAFDMDGDRVHLETSKITFRSLVVDQLDPTINSLLRELGKGRNILTAELRDGITKWITFAKLNQVQRVAKAEDWLHQVPISITLEQDYPYWMNFDDGWYFDQGYSFDDGMVFDGLFETVEITADPTTFTIDNDGTARCPLGTITIQPEAASSITNPLIVNNTNGLSVEWTGTLAAGESLVIDFLTRTVEKDGVSQYANFAVSGSKQVEWMMLELGENEISVTGWDSGTVNLYWQWKRHYL